MRCGRHGQDLGEHPSEELLAGDPRGAVPHASHHDHALDLPIDDLVGEILDADGVLADPVVTGHAVDVEFVGGAEVDDAFDELYDVASRSTAASSRMKSFTVSQAALLMYISIGDSPSSL
jgi:hypothetical protein